VSVLVAVGVKAFRAKRALTPGPRTSILTQGGRERLDRPPFLERYAVGIDIHEWRRVNGKADRNPAAGTGEGAARGAAIQKERWRAYGRQKAWARLKSITKA